MCVSSSVYSLFALCEYSVVLCNIFFHYSLAYDLEDHAFFFGAASRTHVA